MTNKLLDITMNDGSRHFGALTQAVLWYEMRDHLGLLEGASVTGFITDNVTEAWIDFTFREHSFSVNDQFGEYLFFVADPGCPDSILEVVLAHSRQLLGHELY
jgi:hypothetical protein